MRQETEPWWKQTQADLRTADLNTQGGQYYVVSWFAQQAAEKALKALIVERTGQLPVRTHDLRFLGTQLGVPPAVDNDLLTLNPVSRLARYPEAGVAPVDAVSATDATRHLEAARRIIGWVANEL